MRSLLLLCFLAGSMAIGLNAIGLNATACEKHLNGHQSGSEPRAKANRS